ncbi:MAG TPA: oligoribonuclease [Coxiellaceae bacterium]|nr:MAG: oligoribonuclease [Gammaproteobacteria bacterium RIFCSPHIGHO2_12_FULL_36_30]HLB56409.1 oligoribonuclease [Coxiellaceae bacterium]
MSQLNENNLVWLDLEMTGLNPDENRIIEIATIVTDSELNIIAEGPAMAIHQAQIYLDQMDKWCTEQHGKSGLTKRVQESNVAEKEAEKLTLEFIKKYVPAKTSPMCGNTIYQDRRFLAKYMPSLEDYFHYRLLDVSTLKILAQKWAPDITKGFKKDSTHLALQDIRDSIEELRYYRMHFIK